jgi:hypothetical protein
MNVMTNGKLLAKKEHSGSDTYWRYPMSSATESGIQVI